MHRADNCYSFLREDNTIQEKIIASLKEGANPSLRYQGNTKLLSNLAFKIVEKIKGKTNLEHILTIVLSLIKNQDYRFVADYLYARRTNKIEILNIFERLIATDNPPEINRLRYQLQLARFLSVVSCPGKADISIISHLEDLFSQSQQGTAIYLIDSSMESPLTALLHDVGVELGTFIEQQYNFPSLNALVRQGVVRAWVLPDGKAIVSKRDNPQKPGRFRKEQFNYKAILSRMEGKNTLHLDKTINKKNIFLKIAQPFAYIWDSNSRRNYALSIQSEGISLEDLLMEECDQAVRHDYLVHCRLILDTLFERGILWGDMSPRNILVQQTEQTISYHIFDFEKTQVMDEPISLEKRIEHCRGQICVEEFGIICTPEEMQICFHGYFNPEEWDFESEEALRFPQRPEVADILKGRGIHDVTLGKYNQTDREMMNARIPDIDPQTRKRGFPGHLNFKVEHYLSCAGYQNAGDYERKTTEILIAAKQYECFNSIVLLLTEATDIVESAFLKTEFDYILDNKSTEWVIPPKQSIKILTHTIDSFYQSRKDKKAFQNLSACWRTMIEEEELRNGTI